MSEQRDPRGANGELLSRQRPAPTRRFQDELRRRLLELDASDRRPTYLWLLVAAYAVAGAVLLIVAAVGVGI